MTARVYRRCVRCGATIRPAERTRTVKIGPDRAIRLRHARLCPWHVRTAAQLTVTGAVSVALLFGAGLFAAAFGSDRAAPPVPHVTLIVPRTP